MEIKKHILNNGLKRISRKNSKYLKLNKNDNKTRLWNAVKTVLRDKIIVLNAFIGKKDLKINNNLSVHLRKLRF